MVFGIIGYGRFGKLWADCLKPFGKVLIYDKKSSLTQLKQVTTQAEILFLLVPISALETCCKKISRLLKPQTIVVDACSVKEYPVQIMKKHLSKKQPIIATHPLFGPDSVAKNGLAKQKIVVHPVQNIQIASAKKHYQQLQKILKQMKLQIIYATPQEHDQQMAISQALVHFVGRGLHSLTLKPQEISTPNYESLVTLNSMVNNDTWQLFLDMQNYNQYTQPIRKTFLKSLQKIDNEIQKIQRKNKA